MSSLAQACAGIALFVALCYVCSEKRTGVRWRPVIVGCVVQLVLALLLLGVPAIASALLLVNRGVAAIERATNAGTEFVFGYVGGAAAPFDVADPAAQYVFAFRVLPQILVFTVLVALLWHWRVLPTVVRVLGKVLERLFGLGGAVGTGAAASLFLGMVETPLVIRAYLDRLSRSELFTVMVCGMSTVAGSIMVLYASVLSATLAAPMGHIISASVLNVIGAIYVSRILIPPAEDEPRVSDSANSLTYASSMDALARGTMDGLRLAVNVGAMLIVLLSLVALANQFVGLLEASGGPLTLQRLLGWAFAPVAWLMGIPWGEAGVAGGLLGVKLILNELVAFVELSRLPSEVITSTTRMVMVYALCGFANFGSLGILVAGLTTLVPEKKSVVLNLALRSLGAGTVVAFITGAVVSCALALTQWAPWSV